MLFNLWNFYTHKQELVMYGCRCIYIYMCIGMVPFHFHLWWLFLVSYNFFFKKNHSLLLLPLHRYLRMPMRMRIHVGYRKKFIMIIHKFFPFGFPYSFLSSYVVNIANFCLFVSSFIRLYMSIQICCISAWK